MISSKEAVVQAGGAVNELVGEAGKAVRKLLGGWTTGDSCYTVEKQLAKTLLLVTENAPTEFVDLAKGI